MRRRGEAGRNETSAYCSFATLVSTKSSRFQPADGSDKTPAATSVLYVRE